MLQRIQHLSDHLTKSSSVYVIIFPLVSLRLMLQSPICLICLMVKPCSTPRCLMVNLAILGGSSLIWLQSCETLHRPMLGDARHKPPGPWISSGREQKTDFNHQTSDGKHWVSTCLYHQQVVITWDSWVFNHQTCQILALKQDDSKKNTRDLRMSFTHVGNCSGSNLLQWLWSLLYDVIIYQYISCVYIHFTMNTCFQYIPVMLLMLMTYGTPIIHFNGISPYNHPFWGQHMAAPFMETPIYHC